MTQIAPLPTPEFATLSAQLDHFLVILKVENNLADLTVEAYASDLNQYLGFLEERSMTAAGIEQIRSFLLHLKEQNYKATSIKRKIASLQSFYGFLENEMLIARSPMSRLKKGFRIDKRLPKVCTRPELTKLIEAPMHRLAEGATGSKRQAELRFICHRDRAIIELFFATGIRISELCGICLEHLNLTERTIIVFGKGHRERTVYYSSKQTGAALTSYLERRAERACDNFLFINRNGRGITPRAIQLMFQKYRQRCGISRHLSPHSLRHTMATMVLENGADLRAVQEILGHKSVATTQIYTEVTIARQRETMDRFHTRDQLTKPTHSCYSQDSEKS